MTSLPVCQLGLFRGKVVVSSEADGYGFVEPEGGGGQLLFRHSSVACGALLRVGESVRFALGDGSFALEAVAVTRSQVGMDEQRR